MSLDLKAIQQRVAKVSRLGDVKPNTWETRSNYDDAAMKSQADVPALLAEVERLRVLLDSFPCCPVHDMEDGHSSDCQLAALIGAEKEKA